MSQDYRNGKGKNMTDNSDAPSVSILTGSIQWGSSWPELVEGNDRQILFSYLRERFGIPENRFDEYLLFKRKRSWWLLRKSPWISSASQLKVSVTGLRAFQSVGRFIKPSTRLIQIFGQWASRAKVEVGFHQLKGLLKGELLKTDLEIENGYVILIFEDRPLGLGLLIDGKIHSQLPQRDLFTLDR